MVVPAIRQEMGAYSSIRGSPMSESVIPRESSDSKEHVLHKRAEAEVAI